MHYLIKYRSEIDGLRALAVIPVILFHAGFSTFSGGFIGVDVFFVISGYLITSIIRKEINNRCFTFSDFYERRARRIIPALTLVIICCILPAWFFLLPQEMDSFSKSILYTAIFSSNLYFARSINYFSQNADLNPLLHTWTLSVEEQFYIAFPVILLVIARCSQRMMIAFLAFIGIVSIVAAQLMIESRPNFVFFQLPTRSWELIIGCLIAITNEKRDIKKHSYINGEIGSFIGLILIISSALMFDKNTPSPSLYTLIPTLGATLVIIYANKNNITGKILSSKPFVSIGLISYSAYLWHQPLFAFVRIVSNEEFKNVAIIASVLVTFFLSYLTWRFVERPFRNKNLINKTTIFKFTIVTMIGFVTFGFFGKETDGFPFRYTSAQQKILEYQNYPFKKFYRDEICLLIPEQNFENFLSDCYANENQNELLIWGDSHAATLNHGLMQINNNITQLTTTVCPPVYNLDTPWRKNCLEINNFVKSYIEREKPSYIVLHANWSSYEGLNLYENLNNTINSIKLKSPNSNIILVGPVPHYKPWLPELIIKNKIKIDERPLIQNYNRVHFNQIDSKLFKLAQSNNIHYISMINEFCNDDGCKVFLGESNEISLSTWDYGHLTAEGSIFVSHLFKKQIKSHIP